MGRVLGLFGVNLNRAPGHYHLTLGDETVDITVIRRAYPSSTITVPQKFIEPPTEVQTQINEEVAIKQNVFESSDRTGFGKVGLSRRPILLILLPLACGALTTPGHSAYIANFGRIVIARHVLRRRLHCDRPWGVHRACDFIGRMPID
jgi:hypothetical protein